MSKQTTNLLASQANSVYTFAMNYTTLRDSDELSDFCQTIRHQAWLAIDTEFIRQNTYYPILSLVQICSQDDQLVLIDPLTIDDLTPLWSLLADPAICKVFHSARQDIEVLFQLGHLMPQNLFDTQIAGVFLGYGDMAGFARVVEAEFSVELDKKLSRTNWLQRPLSEPQIQYALDDVRYLAPFYRRIQQRLTTEQKQALDFDFKRLLDPTLYIIEPNQAWLKVKGTKGLNSKKLGIVKSLAAWRETEAVRQNLPRKWILDDDAIVQLAKRPAVTVEGLYKIPELKPASIRQYGEAIIQQLDIAFAHPEDWPKKPSSPSSPTPEEARLLSLGQDYAQHCAQQQGITLSNLCNKQDLLRFIRQQPNVLEQGWRYEILGKPLKNVILDSSDIAIIYP